MKVEVINTGTELLLGNVVNTHLAYLGQTLFPLGLRIDRQTTVPDGSAIRHALIETFSRADIIIVTGGLGPTTDDITREITAELLGLALHLDETVRAAIELRVKRHGFTMKERMLRQALAPQGATVLPNDHGTAPGLYLAPFRTPTLKTPHLFLLPGPPRELKPMFANYALPILRTIAGAGDGRECRVYHVVGMGESAVEEIIGLDLSKRGDLEVGYCARPNEVDLRLIAPPALLDEIEPAVIAALGRHLVSRGESIEHVVINRLRETASTVAMTESCTGGFLAHRLTNIPGASAVFVASLVTYANEAKTHFAGVPADLIAAHGAVSAEVARAMAEGAMKEAGTNFGLGITGIAGPGGGTEEKPVGTVFIALAERGATTQCRREYFPTDRETFKERATQIALDLLRLRLT